MEISAPPMQDVSRVADVVLTERDLRVGFTVDISLIPLAQKYAVAVLLAIAICEQIPFALLP